MYYLHDKPYGGGNVSVCKKTTIQTELMCESERRWERKINLALCKGCSCSVKDTYNEKPTNVHGCNKRL